MQPTNILKDSPPQIVAINCKRNYFGSTQNSFCHTNLSIFLIYRIKIEYT